MANLRRALDPLHTARNPYLFLMGLTEAVGLTGPLPKIPRPPHPFAMTAARQTLAASFQVLMGHLAAAIAGTAITGGFQPDYLTDEESPNPCPPHPVPTRPRSRATSSAQ